MRIASASVMEMHIPTYYNELQWREEVGVKPYQTINLRKNINVLTFID